MSNCKCRYQQKTFNSPNTALDKINAGKCYRICENMWHMCEYMQMTDPFSDGQPVKMNWQS